MRQRIIKFLETLHLRIFGHEMSQTMRQFLSNLSWSFFGVILSAFILFVVNVVAGRLLGPTDFGRYNLVFNIASFSAVFIALGFDSTALRFISAAKDKNRINHLVSNSLIAVGVISVIYFLFGLILRPLVAGWLNTTVMLVTMAVVYSVIYTFRNLSDGLTKAMQLFKRQAMVKIVESIIVLTIILVCFFVLKQRFYYNYVFALIVGGLATVGLYIYPLRKYLGSWQKDAFDLTKNYQKIAVFVGFIGITIATIDKFFVAKFLGAAQLGLYSAYLVTSTAVISQLVVLANNVFFPMVNQVEDKKQIMKKIDQLAKFMFLPIIIFSALISFVVIKIFGAAYEINWIYIALVSLIAFGQVLIGFYGSIIASSENYLRFNAKIYYFKPVFIGGLYFLAYFCHYFNLYSIILIVLSSYIFDYINTKITIAYIKEE